MKLIEHKNINNEDLNNSRLHLNESGNIKICISFVNYFVNSQTVPLWLRYVDDTFTAVHKDEIDIFHEHLNRQNVN